LDFYRFVAASLVMAYHFIPGFKSNFGNFNLCVDFFFMLSGFVMFVNYERRMEAPAQYLDFLVSRLARIYPLHALTMAFYIGVGLALASGGFHIAHASDYKLDGVVQNLALIHAWNTTDGLTLNGPSWSISAEWAVYLLFPAFILLARKCGAGALPLAAAACIAGLEAMTHFGLTPETHWTEMSWDYGALRAVPSFIIGIWLASHVESRRSDFPVLRLGAGLFLLTLASIALGAPRLAVLVGFAGALYLTACGERRAESSFLQKPLFGVLGDSSYAIYMLHGIVLAVSATLLKPALGDGALKIAAAMALTIVVAIACHRWFERPMQRGINRAWRKAAPRPAPSRGDRLTPRPRGATGAARFSADRSSR
jgi:peptidoglycan/LPS O-acetylase OafA/YrhL